MGVLGGKEFNVWTETQLSSINRAALKKRCLDLRDHVGLDLLPPMPRQPEGMVEWMLGVQKLAIGVDQPAVYQANDEYYAPAPSAAAPDMFDRGPSRGAAYGDYDQEPISRGGYAPSDAVSVAESRVGAFGSKTFVFEGKEYNVWTEGQLSAMGRDALKNRCLDFRDHIGRDRLPPMPRHPEAMVQWLLCVQKVVMQGGDSDEHPTGGMMRGGPPGGGPPGGMARGGPAIDYQRGYEPSEVGSQAPSEAQSNYEKNMQDAQAIRRRNQGSGGLW